MKLTKNLQKPIKKACMETYEKTERTVKVPCRLLTLDLDGTLLNSDHDVSPGNIERYSARSTYFPTEKAWLVKEAVCSRLIVQGGRQHWNQFGYPGAIHGSCSKKGHIG